MANTAQKLMYLYPESEPLRDWVVVNDGRGAEEITYWNADLGSQPTQAELDALSDQEVTEGLAKHKAQIEKAAATVAVDTALERGAHRLDRALVSVALSISSAINKDRETLVALKDAILAATTLADLKTRVNAINFPAQVSQQQVINAIKAAIAETPE